MLEVGNSYSCYLTHRGCHMVLVLDVVQAVEIRGCVLMGLKL
jgi:hypothetical protein